MRSTFPGMSDIQSLSKMNGVASGIYENDRPIYNLEESQEENKLFQINDSIRDLIKDLEIKGMEQEDES